MKTCDHRWEYAHTLYSGGRGGIVIRRRCSACKIVQVGEVKRWRPERPGEFDHTVAETLDDQARQLIVAAGKALADQSRQTALPIAKGTQ